jgi:hypothetical protein
VKFNTFCFSATKMVTRTSLSIAYCVHCLSIYCYEGTDSFICSELKVYVYFTGVSTLKKPSVVETVFIRYLMLGIEGIKCIRYYTKQTETQDKPNLTFFGDLHPRHGSCPRSEKLVRRQ